MADTRKKRDGRRPQARGAVGEGPATKYWLAVATNENCAVLAGMGYPFYALTSRPAASIGDYCVLYRSGKNAGFIGAFRFVSSAVDERVKLADFRTFATKLPWVALAVSDANPVEIRCLVDDLQFVTNKAVYSMSLRNCFRTIPEHDYSLIYSQIMKRAASIHDE